MSLNEAMTSVMDVVRYFTGRTDKMSVEEATKALLELKSNPFDATPLPYETDFNQLSKSGLYTAWIKPMKNAPLKSSDQGSLVLVTYDKSTKWCAQVIFTFYSGAFYRADSFDQIKAGNKDWKKLGGGVKAVLSAILQVRGCAA